MPRPNKTPTDAEKDLEDRMAQHAVERRIAERLAQRTTRGDGDYVRSTWEFQRGVVLAINSTVPLALVAMAASWWKYKTPEPWTIGAFATAVAAGLVSAMLFWRCPRCGVVLFRGGRPGTPAIGFLEDPNECRGCGASLRRKT